MDRWNASRLGWLALASFSGFGCTTLHKLAEVCDEDGEQAWHISRKQLETILRKQTSVEQFCTYRAKTQPEKLASDLAQHQIQFILDTDALFPLDLKTIPQPPKALFIKGSLDGLHEPRIAIIGTRSMTSYGKHVTTELAQACAHHGITVISGLALGIDGCAHQASLDAQGKTIAVLGSGLDQTTIYPRQHARLAQQICDKEGALISEGPIGYNAYRFDFPLRNRLISGLAQATIVVEGAHKSGSLITAHLAIEQGRDVLAVPGSIISKQSQGTNALIQKGAIPCLGIDSILETLHLEPSRHAPSDIQLTPEEKQFLSVISGPISIDEVSRLTKVPIQHALQLIGRLELNGFISRLDRGRITRHVRTF